LSRDHTIVVSESGLITLTGGKWTTYRKMAEDVVDQAERMAGLSHKPSPTAALSIHGAAGVGAGNTEITNFYGSDSAGIAALVQADPALGAPLHPRLAVQGAEVLWHVRHEMARTVEDVLARRTRSLMLDARGSIAAAPAVARLIAGELNRDEAWEAAQVVAYTKLANGWILGRPEPAAPRIETSRVG
jgi:glycerol-3-phosphate dehydrogenase